jgi:hypothetical protein
MIQRRRWPREHVAAMPVSDEDRRIMCDVGLPEVLLMFEERIVGAGDGRWVLGHDHDAPLWLQSDGAVVIGQDGRYMNSSIAGLAACLEQYARYSAEVAGLADDDPRILSVIDDVERLMRDADPRAFVNAELCWPVVIEQMRYGHL